MFFGGIRSIDAFVCAIVIYFHVSMCISACPLFSAFPSFLIPRYTHSCVYSWVFPLSSAISVSFIRLMSFFHIGLYFGHFQKWFQSSWLRPHEVHRIVLVVVVIPFRYMALCSMFLNQELCLFLFRSRVLSMFLPISLHGISVSSFNLFSQLALHPGSLCVFNASVMSLTVIWSSCFLPGIFSSVHSFGFGY